jgi:hypothetical protein
LADFSGIGPMGFVAGLGANLIFWFVRGGPLTIYTIWQLAKKERKRLAAEKELYKRLNEQLTGIFGPIPPQNDENEK